MLNRVAIYSAVDSGRTGEVVRKLIGDFCRMGITMQIYEKAGAPPVCEGGRLIEKFSSLGELNGLPDLVLSVGGDGTFLETMMKVVDLGIPVAGINTGRLGFLANISEDELNNSLDMLFRGEYEILERSLLSICSPVNIFGMDPAVALNEITVQKSDPGMITVNVYVDGLYLNTYWSDGLIISSATGSTAYNLSVGGPILSPGDESIIISSISPHNLTIRPIIVSGGSRLRLVTEGRSSDYLVTCDSRSGKLPAGEQLEIERYEKKLKTVMLRGRDFYSTLRNKLMWGADRRN
ncbi:MAG TPA: NAD(+)/NADH kinase [Bacteroidales bacterium]|nr:NAD(+)/NADH kinase [Bacteroidales bacterium]